MSKEIFPKFKKKVSDFIKQEEGKITKQSALALGAFTFGAILGSIKDVDAFFIHTNDYGSYSWDSGTGEVSVTHSHHSTHSTHSSHGSHSSY